MLNSPRSWSAHPGITAAPREDESPYGLTVTVEGGGRAWWTITGASPVGTAQDSGPGGENPVPVPDLTSRPVPVANVEQARLFSYLDTQLTRLGGPNFTQLPVNRPHCPVNDMLRDGMHQAAVHTGIAPYQPNSLDGGQPLPADAGQGGYVQAARPVQGTTVRANPASFGDHFTQPAMFYRSLTPLEQAHIVEAFTFELGELVDTVVAADELDFLSLGSFPSGAARRRRWPLLVLPRWRRTRPRSISCRTRPERARSGRWRGTSR
jgi:Catalase/Catalase-related immune-responsive